MQNSGMNFPQFLFFISMLFFLSTPFRSLGAEPKLENIAQGREYVLEPKPNYHLCSDPGDGYQLTDGKYTDGYFWSQKSTVGWKHVNPVTITIDLGQIQPLRGLSLNTAAGVAGVSWPEAIFILLSEDNEKYFYAGDLIELHLAAPQKKQGTYETHRFWTDALSKRARFVKLMILPKGTFIFSDEIEVFKSREALPTTVEKGREIEDISDFAKKTKLLTHAVRRRLQDDLSSVQSSMNKLPNSTMRLALKAELGEIKDKISEILIKPWDLERTVFPLNDLHRRIFSAQSQIWFTRFKQPLVAWQKNHWDMLSPTEFPLPGGAKINVCMMRGEFRSAAFNLSNITKKPLNIRLRIKGFSDKINSQFILLHDVPFTDTKSGIPVAAALPFLIKENDYYHTNIESGMTKQIWLTFHSQGISAGQHRGTIDIENHSIQIPISLKVYPIDFPVQPSIHLCGWDYTYRNDIYDVTPQNRYNLVEHMNNYFVDTAWARSDVMQKGKYNEQGRMIIPPASMKFKEWIDLWPRARYYCVFCNFGKNFAGFEMGSSSFERAVSEWIAWWVILLKTWGIRPDQLALLIKDEPRSREDEAIIIEYAKIIKRVKPEVVIWQTLSYRNPENASNELYKTCDILCPSLTAWLTEGKQFSDFYLGLQKQGKDLWFYSSRHSGKLLDPYAYYRLQHWFCFKYGAKGSCFWAFADASGASTWNEYIGKRGAYTPLFLDKQSVISGKHMEAIREGIEDYEYLKILRDFIISASKSKIVDPDTLRKANELLEHATESVISGISIKNQIMWEEPIDRSVADQIRQNILEFLIQLDKGASIIH